MGDPARRDDVYALEVDGDYGMPAMIGVAQTFGDLLNANSHTHTIVPNGVFLAFQQS